VLAGGAHRRADVADGGDVVIFDHDPVVEPQPVVVAAPGADGVLLEEPEAGGGLAGVQQPDRRAGQGGGVLPGQGGDPRQPLDDVERGAFAPQQRAGGRLHFGQHRPGGHGGALGDVPPDEAHRRIEQPENLDGEVQAGQDAGFAGAEHGPGASRVEAGEAVGGQVARSDVLAQEGAEAAAHEVVGGHGTTSYSDQDAAGSPPEPRRMFTWRLP